MRNFPGGPGGKGHEVFLAEERRKERYRTHMATAYAMRVGDNSTVKDMAVAIAVLWTQDEEDEF